jgi:peroxiredoxin
VVSGIALPAGARGPRGRIGAGLSLSLVLVLLVSACGDAPPAPRNGEPAPGFELPRLDGTPLAFPADLRGQVTAVRFWADWCPFCESEMRDIEPVYRTYRDRGLVVLAVNVRQDRETAARFVEGLGVSYEVLLDEQGDVARAYGVIGLPTTFFVDREGRLATRILGESTPEVFERIVGELL